MIFFTNNSSISSCLPPPCQYRSKTVQRLLWIEQNLHTRNWAQIGLSTNSHRAWPSTNKHSVLVVHLAGCLAISHSQATSHVIHQGSLDNPSPLSSCSYGFRYFQHRCTLSILFLNYLCDVLSFEFFCRRCCVSLLLKRRRDLSFRWFYGRHMLIKSWNLKKYIFVCE